VSCSWPPLGRVPGVVDSFPRSSKRAPYFRKVYVGPTCSILSCAPSREGRMPFEQSQVQLYWYWLIRFILLELNQPVAWLPPNITNVLEARPAVIEKENRNLLREKDIANCIVFHSNLSIMNVSNVFFSQ
jgi:hypothetical protein